MKPKQLILFVLFAFFAAVAKAQWTEVTPSEEIAPVNAVSADGTTEYWLYNVEADGYFVAGNSWWTQACVGKAEDMLETSPMGFTIRFKDPTTHPGFYQMEAMSPDHRYASFAGQWKMPFDNAGSIFTDYGSGDINKTYWTLSFAEDGTCQIYSFMNQDKPLGIVAEGGEIKFLENDYNESRGGGTATGAYTLNNVDGVLATTWKLYGPANIAAVIEYQAYLKVINSIEGYVDNGFEGAAAFEDQIPSQTGSADAEHIAAIEAVGSAVLAAYVEWVANSTSPSNPKDMSELILNRSFDNETYENWSGSGFGKGGTTGPCAERYNMKYDTWQKISNIPNGIYRVSVDGFFRNGTTANAMATKGQKLPAYLYGFNGTDTLKTSLMGMFDGIEPDQPLYVDGETSAVSGGMTYYVPNTMKSACDYFDAGYYHGNSVVFAVTDGYAIIGLKKEVLVGTTDWTLIDNFGLEYWGDGAEAYKAWAQDLANNSKSYDDVEHVTADVLDAYNAVLAAAGKASTYEAVVEATKAIEAEAEKVDANIAKWNEYIELITQAAVVAKEFKGPEAGELGDYIELDAEEILDAKALSTEEIAEEIAKLQGMMDAATENGITEGANVTSKIKNASFKNGFTDWTNSNGGAVTGTFGGLVDFPCVEVYENVVDVTQTVTGLPKGVYELSCQAFERPASNGSWTGNEPSKVFLYMNNVKTPVQNIKESALPADQAENYVNCFIEGSIAEEYHNTGGTTNLDYLSDFGYVPNGMSGASYAFRAERYKQAAKGLVTDGVMKIGLTSNGVRAHWVLWSGFTLKFLGMDPEVLKPMVEEEMEKINLDDVFGSDVKAEAEALLVEADEMTDGDQMLDMIDKLVNMNEKVEASKALFAEVAASRTKAEETLADNEAYLSEDLIDEVNGLLVYVVSDIEEGTATDEDAKKYIEDLKAAIANMEIAAHKGQIMNDYADELAAATVDNPADLTDVIKNANFDEGADQVWVSTKNGGNGPVLGNGIGGTPSAEFWNGTASDLKFDINQTIAYLPEGTYVLSADAANSLNGMSSNGETGRAYLYVEKNGEGVDSVAVNVIEGGCIEKYSNYSVVFYIEEGAVKVGFKTVGTMEARWFVCDNFRLYYYGKEDVSNNTPTNGPEEITEDVPFYQIAGVPTPDDAVDLGLSVKWAPYNLGTSATNKYGSYYPLGSLVEQDGTVNQTDAEFNGNTDQELCDLSSTRFDATTDQWGIGWRLPTIDELKELQEKTTVKSVILSGVKGYMVTSKVNGNTIFIPASGRIPFQGTLGNVDTAAYLWSGNHQGLSGNGWSLTNNGWSNSLQSLSMGYSMRPVYDAKDDYKRNGGIYYLYNKEADMFLERGEAWGGQATLGKYGLPVRIASASTSASTDKLTRLRMYDTGKSFGLGDNLSDEVFLDSKYSAMRTYRMTTTTDGVTFTDENGLAVYIDGKVLKASASRTPAVWQLVTKAEHDKMLADAAEKQISDAFTAAGVNMTAELVETDYTNAIASASLKGSSEGWTWTPKLRVGSHTTSAYCFEGYKAQGTLSQTVTGLAPGLYKITANAMFRNGSNKFMTDMKTDGYTPSTAYLQANGYQARVASWAEYNTAANVPNSMAEFDQVVTANPDNYKATLYTVVGADGKLDISFVQDDFVGYGWFAVNNVQLNLVEEDGYDFPEDAIAQGEVGTCVWYITGGNELVIAPTDGVSGDLPEEGWNVDFDPDLLEEFVTIPWYYYSNRITSAKIMQGVNAKSCSYMFYGLSKMESLDLSNFNTQNVTNLTNMFANCSNLTTIISNNEIPAPLKTGTFESLPTRATCTLQVPAGTKALYAAADGWNELGIIDDGLKYALNVEGNVTLASLTGYADKFNVSNNSTGRLTVDIATGSRIGDYVQQASGSAIFNQAVTADNVSVEINLVPKQWKFISFPYDVKVADIQKPANAVFAIRKYSGEKRANGEDAWMKVGATETLNANEGYIISADNGSTAQIKMTFPAAGSTTNFFGRLAKDMTLASHSSAKVADCDWNFIGNPFPSYYTTQSISEDVVLTVWNGSGYTAYSTVDDNYMLKPFEAFFIQSPLNVESISLPAGGRSHGTATTAARLRHSGMSSNRTVLNFVICDSDNNIEKTQSIDRARIVINELSSTSYEAGRDAVKFMSIDKSIPQIFVVSNGESLAIDERPMANGHATLGVYSEEETDYILSLRSPGVQSPRTSEPIYIIDNVTGMVTDLTTSDYRFTATAGTDSNRFTVVLNGETDGIEEIHNSQSTMHNYYNLAGQRINNAKAHKGIVIINRKKVKQ